MPLTKEQAQIESLAKWNKIKEDLNKVFYDVNMSCGYCVYAIERTEDIFTHKCGSCKRDFPAISRICSELVDFFSAKHGELDKMIAAIIKVISEESK